MKQLFIAGVLALGIITLGALALASGTQKPVLTPVTVAVEGITCPSCLGKLQQQLTRVTGVTNLKTSMTTPQVTATLDESKITAGAFLAKITAISKTIEPKSPYTAKLLVYVDAAMCAGQEKMCPACFTEIPKVLKTVPGVSSVTMDNTGRIATVTLADHATVTTGALGTALGKSNFKFTTSFAPPAAQAKTKASTGTEAGCDTCGGCGQ